MLTFTVESKHGYTTLERASNGLGSMCVCPALSMHAFVIVMNTIITAYGGVCTENADDETRTLCGARRTHSHTHQRSDPKASFPPLLRYSPRPHSACVYFLYTFHIYAWLGRCVRLRSVLAGWRLAGFILEALHLIVNSASPRKGLF